MPDVLLSNLLLVMLTSMFYSIIYSFLFTLDLILDFHFNRTYVVSSFFQCHKNKYNLYLEFFDGSEGSSNGSDSGARKGRTREEQETWNSSRAENMTEAINRGVLREHTTDGWKPHKRRINSANLLPGSLDTGRNRPVARVVRERTRAQTLAKKPLTPKLADWPEHR